ncbi:malonate--CoA ligase ACSF3, mitochondrial-like [Daphnia carinata]|uniref:malonate--CoA ligase ACSF3, mitochondrial-like n=1 Tax=Daphnia carinata TaxID=120202 RepID=UPI00257C0BA3|nr:malonate--CoA ligase ACSF3, mitochondrial-like [Daphnia carinata]
MAFLILKPVICFLSSISSNKSVTLYRAARRGFCSIPHGKTEEKNELITPVFQIATNHLNKIALKDKNGTHTYQDILRKSLLLARKIQGKLGVNKTQERIVFLCPNDVTYVLAQWACWASGHIAVPLSPVHPPSLLSYYIQDSEASLAITTSDPSNVELMTSLSSNLNGLPLLVIDDTWSRQDSSSSRPVGEKNSENICSSVRVETNPPSIDSTLAGLLSEFSMPDNFYRQANAMILYTSGTTGKPKGVLLSHVNIDSQVRSLVSSWSWSPADVILHTLPLYHTHGIVNALLCPLYVGARCIMLPKFDASLVWSNLLGVNMSNSERPTVFMAVPTIYSMLINEYQRKFAGNPKLKEYVKATCSTKMRLMVSGSALLPESVFHQWRSITGHQLLERYGMTEIGMALSNPIKGERRPGHVGFPLPGVRVRIAEFKTSLDGSKVYYDILAEGNSKATKVEPGKAGLSGELLVRGNSVFQGYWNKPDVTEKEFTKDGWFKTGDIAQFNNGYYKILGRASADIIKSGGHKLSALQIETELLAHPRISDCAVVGLPDPVWGQAVAAVLVPKERSKLEVDELKSWCKKNATMAPYAIPTVWKVVDSIPRNAMGKINKKNLVNQMFTLPTSP